jgi:hypothetical protein
VRNTDSKPDVCGRVLSCGIWHHMVWLIDTSGSDEFTASWGRKDSSLLFRKWRQQCP